MSIVKTKGHRKAFVNKMTNQKSRSKMEIEVDPITKSAKRKKNEKCEKIKNFMRTVSIQKLRQNIVLANLMTSSLVQ